MSVYQRLSEHEHLAEHWLDTPPKEQAALEKRWGEHLEQVQAIVGFESVNALSELHQQLGVMRDEHYFNRGYAFGQAELAQKILADVAHCQALFAKRLEALSKLLPRSA